MILSQNNSNTNHFSRNNQSYPYYPPQSAQTQPQRPAAATATQPLDLDPAVTPLSSTLDNIPAAAAAIAATQRFRTPNSLQSHSLSRPSSQQGFVDREGSSHPLSQVPDLMPSDSWMLPAQQSTPRSQRFHHHQRESSLSSLGSGSNGPASPFNANTSNPQIAVLDSTNDGFHDMSGAAADGSSYGLGKSLTMADNFYTSALATMNNNAGNLNGQNAAGDMGAQARRGGGLAPAAEISTNVPSLRSHPASVASSTTGGGDSPVTPSFHETEEHSRRQKNGEPSTTSTQDFLLFSADNDDLYSHLLLDTAFGNSSHPNNVPKLDRTMTDIYNDELYNPNFTITSASPPPQSQVAMSPSNELFAKRLQAANSQHLSAVQSPVSNASPDRSPFRQGSPYASTLDDLPKVGMNQVRLSSAQQVREKRKAEQDAKELQKQLAQQSNAQQATPSTISPKDAMLEFNEADDAANFPLFPSQESDPYGLQQTSGGNNNAGSGTSMNANVTLNGNFNSNRATPQHASPAFPSMASTPIQSGFNFSMPTNIQMPQQYPFVPRRQQQASATPSVSAFSRVSSADPSIGDDGSDVSVQKPGRTNADGGTYTCTYHGCTLRFETPALLQKHKREGHRQANALNHIRASPASTPSSTAVLNSQAGPHRCDRINPSTGKPCNTVFSRPYDLTRHEDTIHNARKQKVRCDLCTEEKTFSRADALTRHYRVCHPDVEFPGKHRRRAAVGV
ncbi:hypothetical protein F4780DRAFT_154738 [Xylariomycetidae sp. FL0641]|nr:hypothetical protein F4780DRAFT_154738 [Xylariomycetidae sp. FL0641]